MRMNEMQADVMRDNSGGFSLIEVLASIVILALFIGSLVVVTTEALSQAHLNAQKQSATMIGHDLVAQMAVNGIANTNIPLTRTVNGTTYSIHVDTTPSTLTSGLTDVTVTVSWQTDVNDSPATLDVTVEQVLSQ